MVWGYILLFALFGAAVLYFLAPDLMLHRWGFGSWKRLYTSGVSITFDDGPDPEITPQILAVLADHQVTATFFVVGEKAARFPELITQIRAQGHQLGAHAQHHRHAWTMGPWQTWREWDQAVGTLENLSGEPVNYIRPPWGAFNLVTWLWFRARKKRAVLWNVEGHDWQARHKPEDIAARILRRTNEGSIVVLHDAGGEEGAPANTLGALDIICHKIVSEQKLPITALDFPEWSLLRRLGFRAWEKWEHLFARTHHVERINATNWMRLSRGIYAGPDLHAEDGRRLARQGDLVGEIHFDSVRMMGKETDYQAIALRALRQVKASMPELAAYVAGSPAYREIEVFQGLSLLNRGVKGLGFQVQDVPPSLNNWWVGVLEKIIMAIYHPMAGARLRKGLGQPKIVWISKEELLKRWLK